MSVFAAVEIKINGWGISWEKKVKWLSDVCHIKAYISVLEDGSQVALWHRSRLIMKSALLKWWVLDFVNCQTEHPWIGHPWFGSVKCLCFWSMMRGLSRYNIHLVKWQHFFGVVCCDRCFSLKPAESKTGCVVDLYSQIMALCCHDPCTDGDPWLTVWPLWPWPQCYIWICLK